MHELLNTERMAQMLGISPQRLRELVRRGTVTAAGRGRFDPFAVVPAYVASLREAAAGRGSEGNALDLAQERAALAKAQREKLEREAAQARRELIPATEARDAWMRHITAAKTRILGIPSECKTRAADLPLATVATIDAVCREALENLAEGAAHG